jgi:hypothetical protein
MFRRIDTHRIRSDRKGTTRRWAPPRMSMHTVHRDAVVALAACLFAMRVAAVEPTQQQARDEYDARGADEIRIQEVFTSHLPETIADGAFRASLHPHMGDIRDNDHIRVSTGVRYGATSRLELSAGADFYFSHGAGDVDIFDEGGISKVFFGAKLNVGRNLLYSWRSSIGFDASFPTDNPPRDFTDGMKHFTPYVTFSRRLTSRPSIRVFWGMGLDLVEHTEYPGVLRTNQLDDHSANITAGFVIDRKNLHYSFEAQVATTRVIGGTDEDVLTLRPGIIWEVPKLRDRTRRSNWMVGVGGRVSFGPDGTDIGASGKLRYNFDLKYLFTRKKPVE